MKIGILGGTFDPIHQGHLLLARAAQTQYSLDKVLFVPALIPPHKTSRNITPAPYRYRMVELAIKDEKDFEISHIEFDRPEISYTVETLRILRAKHQKDQFFLIMGADAAADIAAWKEPEEILKMAKVLVACRSGYVFEKRKGIEPVEMKEMPLSSSSIREKLASGIDAAADAVPPEVETYIKKMNLYSKK